LLKDTKEEIFGMLKDYMLPEFLNRIDDKLMFLPLDKEQIKKIALLQIKDLEKMLEKQGLKIEVTDNALDLIADLGYEPAYGARPLKRVIQREIINEISKKILAGDYAPGEVILIDAIDGNFVFDEKPQEPIE